MNFIFVSPQFPKTYYNFCLCLKNRGVNTLGIGDTPYNELDQNVINSLNEYYYVSSLADYNQMYKAVAYFSFKYGKIDWLESNNEFWLEMDAKLRTDFNINSGLKNDCIDNIKYKSKMKESYKKAKIKTARYLLIDKDIEKTKEFIKEVNYPVIVKPDNGCGAEATYKLKNEKDLLAFYNNFPNVQYIMEEYIDGTIISFDGIANSKSEVIFYTSNYFPTPIIDIVGENRGLTYWTVKDVNQTLKEMGQAAIKAFNVKSRFFHLEFFILNNDCNLGKKGDIVALEVNMRPAGGYTPDMINYANSCNVYDLYAQMIIYDKLVDYDINCPKQYCVYVSKRDQRNYVHSDNQIREKYFDHIVMSERMPEALAKDMGNLMFTAVFKEFKEVEEFIKYVSEEVKNEI